MERPQNGVNGNIPQQSYGFLPGGYPIGSSIQRANGQTIFGYDNMQPVLPGHYGTAGFNSNIPHNRPLSPPMQPPPYFVPNFSYYQQISSYPTYSQVPFTQQFTNFPQEIPSTSIKPQSNIQTTRKLNPLVVTDPTSNTDVDLKKFQATSEKLITISDHVPDNNNISKSNVVEQNDLIKPIEIVKTENVDNSYGTINIEDPNLEQGKTEESILENTVINEKEIVKSKSLICDSENISDNLHDFKKEESNLNIFEKINEEQDIKMIERMESDDSDLHIKVPEPHVFLKSDEDGFSSDEEITPAHSKLTLLNYHLSVNKKESDETTLKRKLIYDREYLIKFKDNVKSRQKPVNMPLTTEFSEDIIFSQPRNFSCHKLDSSYNQINVEKVLNKKQPLGRQYSSGYKKYANRPTERKQINLEFNENQVFIRSKSGYLPPQFRDKQKAMDPYNELKRNIKSNLNKITPQNFQDCLKEIEKLHIENKEEMSCLINEIFVKAVKEEAYSVTYAQFCNKLASMYIENQSFKGQLLKKCQDMFETPLQAQLITVRNEWEERISNETDLKMKALYESDLEEQVKKAKDKYFGNIRFIGELFLHSLLAAKVILNCISELLNGSDDSDAMLALCKLLETCGKQIDIKHKEQMNNFISRILELSNSNDLEKRIRFKLRDIIDMRIRDWTLRHVQQEKQINPKTIEEQKEEAAAEASAAAMKMAAMNKKRNVQNIQNNSRRNAAPVVNKNVSIKTLSCNRHTVDEKTVLGPAGGSWKTGSGSKSKSHEAEGWTNVSHKLKSAPIRYTSNSRSREQSPQVILTNKYRTFESSAEASGADSRSSTPPMIPLISRAYRVVEPEISDEERADIIFNDLLSTGSFDTNSWDKLRKIPLVIEKWIDDMMEKDISCRRTIGDNFNKLLISKKITTEQIVEGTQSFVSSIDDLICDIPKLWIFFAQFLERFIHDKTSNIKFFENIFKSILPSKDVAYCFSVALHDASDRLGHKIVGQVFHRSLKWNNIVPDNWEKFIKENNLEFTVYLCPLSSCGGDPLHFIEEELADMLSSNSSNENIFDFLENHVDKPTWKKSECTRTITSSILKAIKKMPESSVREYFKNKKEIIKRISNHKPENEMEILKAILNIASELNKDTLILIYDLLITEDIISCTVLKTYLNDKSLQSEISMSKRTKICDPNKFCYLCTKFISGRSRNFTDEHKELYWKYFKSSFSSAASSFAPSHICNGCQRHLYRFKNDSLAKFPFNSPAIWTQVSSHTIGDCYFCGIQKTKGRMKPTYFNCNGCKCWESKNLNLILLGI